MRSHDLDDVGAMVGLAETLLETDLLDEALERLKHCSELEPNNYWVWVGLGKVYFEQEEYAKAIESFKRAIELNEENPYPVKRIGDAQLRLGAFEMARTMYERALKIDPEYYGAKKGLAETMLRLNKLSKAEDLLRELVEEEPGDSELWMLRGYVHLNLGDLQSAEDSFNESITRYYNEVEVHKGLLVIYEKMDRVEEAEIVRGKIRQLSTDADIVLDSELENIDPAIHDIVSELIALGLQVHSAYSGLDRDSLCEESNAARIYFWADYRDAPHHIFTICNMAGWVAYYDDNCIGAVHGGEEPHEVREGWASLLQMARLIMPKLRIHIDVMQERAWRRDLKDEPEQGED